MSEPRIIFLKHEENGEATDALSVTLQNPQGTYGVRIMGTETVMVPPGAPTMRIDVGMYEFDISNLDPFKDYEVFWRVVDSNGNTEFLWGEIPAKEPVSGEGLGPEVPVSERHRGVEVDIDKDGIMDAVAYDLDGDGIAESYDYDGDLRIDEIDTGTYSISPGMGTAGSEGAPVVDGYDGYDGYAHAHPTPIEYDQYGQPLPIPSVVLAGGQDGVYYGDGSEGESTLKGPDYVDDRKPNHTPDGVPDVPSPKGTPSKEGIWGNTFGYDGTSGMLPATGGDRTNRSGPGDGFWDGISYEGFTTPIGPRGMMIKDKAHAMVRAMLKDTDETCSAFTVDEIDIYLEISINAFNAWPTFTAFSWDQLQERWLSCITKHATFLGLYAQGLVEAGREFQINDNGISYTPPSVSEKLHSYGSVILAAYEKEIDMIKKNFKPLPASVGTFTVISISPAIRRLRHLREKRIF